MRLLGTILTPGGQAYEVYTDAPVGHEHLVELRNAMHTGLAAGKSIVLTDAFRLVPVGACPPVAILPMTPAEGDELRKAFEESHRRPGGRSVVTANGAGG